jgi:hypothetical protein
MSLLPTVSSRDVTKRGGLWKHDFVQAEFVGKLIDRNRRYSSTLQSTLAELQGLRNRADYYPQAISEIDARRGLRQSREFVESVRSRGESRP